jgi:hypothetical protein
MTNTAPKPTDIKPPFTLETALAKVKAPKMLGIHATLNELRWLTPKILNGEIARNSSMDAKKSRNF